MTMMRFVFSASAVISAHSLDIGDIIDAAAAVDNSGCLDMTYRDLL